MDATPTPEKIPCRVCGCIDGEPSLCHAVFFNLKRLDCCTRAEPDLCTACHGVAGTDPRLPEDARRCLNRAIWDMHAAAFRGASVPGAYQLRRHAGVMRLKARRITVAAALQGSGRPAAARPN